MGFTGPVKNGLLEQLGVNLDQRSNVATGSDSQSSVPGVFAAGDLRRGQSLIVWAIAEGRRAAHYIDAHLMGSTKLPL
jgi:glutamate synthase (NADPH/NADH) small chain